MGTDISGRAELLILKMNMAQALSIDTLPGKSRSQSVGDKESSEPVLPESDLSPERSEESELMDLDDLYSSSRSKPQKKPQAEVLEQTKVTEEAALLKTDTAGKATFESLVKKGHGNRRGGRGGREARRGRGSKGIADTKRTAATSSITTSDKQDSTSSKVGSTRIRVSARLKKPSKIVRMNTEWEKEYEVANTIKEARRAQRETAASFQLHI